VRIDHSRQAAVNLGPRGARQPDRRQGVHGLVRALAAHLVTWWSRPAETQWLNFGLAIVTAFYLLIQVVCIGTLVDLGKTERPLAEAANSFLGPIGASLIAAGAITSIIGNLNVTLLSYQRIPFAMALQ